MNQPTATIEAGNVNQSLKKKMTGRGGLPVEFYK